MRLMTPHTKRVDQMLTLVGPTIQDRLEKLEMYGKEWADKPVGRFNDTSIVSLLYVAC